MHMRNLPRVKVNLNKVFIVQNFLLCLKRQNFSTQYLSVVGFWQTVITRRQLHLIVFVLTKENFTVYKYGQWRWVILTVYICQIFSEVVHVNTEKMWRNVKKSFFKMSKCFQITAYNIIRILKYEDQEMHFI